MKVENKAEVLDHFYGFPLQDSVGETFFNDTIHFGEASWSFGGLDGSSGPASFPNPDLLLFTPTASSSQKPRFLLGESTASSPADSLPCSDLPSYPGQGACEIKQKCESPSAKSGADRQSPAGCLDEKGTSSPFCHSPSPAAPTLIHDAPLPLISDTDLLKTEGIPLRPTPRILSHSTPASPTATRQSGDVFDISNQNTTLASSSQLPGQVAADVYNDEESRGRLAAPRILYRTQSTDGLSMQARRTPIGFPFVRGSVENPFGNPSTAPMPPPRGTNSVHTGDTPSPGMRAMDIKLEYPAAGDSLAKIPSPQLTSVSDDFPWTDPEMPIPFPSIEKPDCLWDLQGGLMDNESFTTSTATFGHTTLDLAKLTDGFVHPGCEDIFSHNPGPDYLTPNRTTHPSASRPRSQTAGALDVPYSSPMPCQSASLPSTPARRPSRSPSINSRQTTPMSSPLRKVHTIRRASTSPSPARGRPRAGGPGAYRSASAAGDSSVRKRRSSSRRELPRPLFSDKGGFVNFTAHDGQTLMMGVAPSGSSKTKAKREREEQERRRRLEEAAMKAVAAAGGNVELLGLMDA